MMIGLFEKGFANDMKFALDTLSVKNSVIARNIANRDTVDYKSTKLDFKQVMEEYFANKDNPRMTLKLTNPNHIQAISPELDPREFVRHQNNPSLRNDGNDVNVEYEMSQQAEATIRYQMMSDLVGKEITGPLSAARTRS